MLSHTDFFFGVLIHLLTLLAQTRGSESYYVPIETESTLISSAAPSRCYIDEDFPEIFLFFPLVSDPTIRQCRKSWIRASVLPGADGLVGTVEHLPTSLETKTGSQLQI